MPMINTFVAAVLVLFIYAAPDASAETVILKSGKRIVCDIIKETEDAVVISRLNGNVVYSISREDIRGINKSTASEMRRTKALEENIFKTDSAKNLEREKRLESYRRERYVKEVTAAERAAGKLRVPFVKGKPNHVEVLLNGSVKAVLEVDTGASLVMISDKIGRLLGYDSAQLGRKLERDDEYNEAKALRKIQMTLADGSKHDAIRVRLNSVQAGSARLNNVIAAISETAPEHDGLLGMSFLREFHVKLDTENKCLVLEKYGSAD